MELDNGARLTDLFQALGVGERWVVAEVNGEAGERPRMPTFLLHDGDRVEVVRAVAGG
jgi:thiamine biosynthesis protein ThiS